MPSPWRDLTIPLRQGLPVYPDDPPVDVACVRDLAEGAGFQLTSLSTGVHAGTHVDAPSHVFPGAPGVEALPLAALQGPALLIDLSSDLAAANTHIGSERLQLAAALGANAPRRVLLRTGLPPWWEQGVFPASFRALLDGAAQLLVARGVLLVGIDTPSIAPFDAPLPTHRTLLAAGVVVVENLDLRELPPGLVEFVCLPLLIPGADGAPARALARLP